MGKIRCLNCGMKFKGNVETPCPNCEWSVWGYSVEHDDPSFFLEQEKTLKGFWTAYKVLGITAIIVMVIILGVRFLIGPDDNSVVHPPVQNIEGVHISTILGENTFEGV